MSRRRRHRHGRFVLLIAGLLGAAALYVFATPLLVQALAQQAESERLARAPEGRPWRRPVPGVTVTYGELVRDRTMETLAVAWAFGVGASFGSFLNVVVYRAPRGKTLWGRSHCPYCDTQILGRDNIPVFGWLWLRGRCRVCRLPISRRYPLVEALAGGLFVLLLLVELASGGANLPLGQNDRRAGLAWTLFGPDLQLIGWTAFHLGLLITLLCWALIQWDQRERQALPRGLVRGALGMALLVGWAWPDALLASASAGLRAWGLWPGGWLDAIPFDRICGGPLGLLVGWGLGNELDLAYGLGRRAKPGASRALALVGAVLGWQAVFSVALIASFWTFLGARPLLAPEDRRWPAIAWVMVATLIHLLTWRLGAGFPYWPSPLASPQVLAAAGLISVVAWHVVRRRLRADLPQPSPGALEPAQETQETQAAQGG